jgi:hypothetical protein
MPPINTGNPKGEHNSDQSRKASRDKDSTRNRDKSRNEKSNQSDNSQRKKKSSGPQFVKKNKKSGRQQKPANTFWQRLRNDWRSGKVGWPPRARKR